MIWPLRVLARGVVSVGMTNGHVKCRNLRDNAASVDTTGMINEIVLTSRYQSIGSPCNKKLLRGPRVNFVVFEYVGSTIMAKRQILCQGVL